MTGESLTSVGVQGWDPLWSDEERISDYWRQPERSVVAWAEAVWRSGGRRLLDLGCGIGRHAVALARMGFAVSQSRGNGFMFSEMPISAFNANAQKVQGRWSSRSNGNCKED